MPLAPGTRIGPYEILSAIGSGGMGEVYRARDSKLNRFVALKVLPELFARDPERLERFEREARMLAAVNHPHIAQIYGVEESNGTTALVMELIEGETLGERLARAPLSLKETLAIARQVADALEAAHEKGIVHRDLKPANIKLRPDGTAKVLDFGLAKALDRAVEGDAAQSSTVTAVGTRAGVILGTAAYMSPEQARGLAVDKRTDVWAFGCVFYEMLTGWGAFAGETVSDTVARILEREPDWSRVPADTPPGVRRLLRRCLQKDVKLRQRDMGDAQIELHEALNPPPDTDHAGVRTRVRPAFFALGAGVVLFVAAVAALTTWSLKPAEPFAVSRFSHVLPEDQSFTNGARPLVAIAPDGGDVVYAANSRLYRRAIADWNAAPIRGTEGSPTTPFFSPDGQTLGYWDAAARELRRITVTGGTPVSLAGAASVYGASWGSDDRILYAQEDGVWRISANGGPAEHVIPIQPDELAYGPRLLPDGRGVLFSVVARGSMVGQSTAWDTAQVVVQSLDTSSRQNLVHGSDARVLPTGHLLYALDTVLFAIPFDVARREVTGGPVPVVEGVQRMVRGSGGQGGSANYDVSQQGTLIYVPSFISFDDISRRLLAVDKKGNALPLIEDQRNYWRPRISPDGTRIAVEVLQRAGNTTQLWIVDLERRTATPLTVEGQNAYAVWSPDGESLVYRSNRPDSSGIYRQAADGSGAPQLISRVYATPTDMSGAGILAFNTVPSQDIGTLRVEDQSTANFLATPAREHMARFSPDGKWLAYTSNESGQDEVYVRPFPRAEGAARLVSVGGGSGPTWAPDASTLYYRGASGELMAVAITFSPGFTPGRPQPLFRYAGLYRMSGTATAYDIHPDGKRFIMVSEPDAPASDQPRQQVNVVLHWFEELKRLLPTK